MRRLVAGSGGGVKGKMAALHSLPPADMGAAMRKASIHRDTRETRIRIDVNLDGTGSYAVSTGIGFLDHMVEQLSRHSLIDVTMEVEGDLHIDQHHTVEDSALALGQASVSSIGA